MGLEMRNGRLYYYQKMRVGNSVLFGQKYIFGGWVIIA